MSCGRVEEWNCEIWNIYLINSENAMKATRSQNFRPSAPSLYNDFQIKVTHPQKSSC